ncbi:MAG TPA: hypothetical protein VGE41_02825, partial [Verrucomicrobiae bacterium]
MPGKKWLGLLAIILFLLIAFPVEEHYRGKAALARTRAELIAKGEKLDVDQLVVRIPASSNGFTKFMDAFAGFTTLGISNQPPTLTTVSPGKAIVIWQRPGFLYNRKLNTNLWTNLEDWQRKNQEVFANLREALQANEYDSGVNYRQRSNLLLPHLARVKAVAQAFAAATLLDLHQHNPNEAL